MECQIFLRQSVDWDIFWGKNEKTMKGFSYIKDNLFTIIALLFVEIVLYGMGFAFKANRAFLQAMAGVIFFAFLLCFLWDLYRKKRYYDELFYMLDGLDQKYLITEMELQPDFLEGELFRDALYETDKSMKEHLTEKEKILQDFREYLEMWIHEIKVPIAALSLMNYNEDRDLAKQRKEIRRLSYYVEQILFYARADASEKDYLVKECTLDSVVNQVLKDQKELLIGNRISIHKELGDITVTTDSKWLSFMIGQVVNNSVKYLDGRKEQAYISFSARKEGDSVYFSVEDNGIGIPACDVNRIFEKTFTGENGRIGAASTGMGLYICKRLCGKLGHRLYAESEAGKYTKITFVFEGDDFLKLTKS